MKFFRIIRCLQSKSHYNKYFGNFTYAAPVRHSTIKNSTIKTYLKNIGKYSTENDEEIKENTSETETLDIMEQAKYLLFKNSEDTVIKELNSCSSLEDVWIVLSKHKHKLSNEQITQSVLVLKDIERTFCMTDSTSIGSSLEFQKKIRSSKQFEELLIIIQNKLENFNADILSYLFLYLCRLGIHNNEIPMIQISEKIKSQLEEKFDLSICSRWIKVIFLENSVRPYYMSLNLIPKILQSLEKCESVEDLSNISVCLNKLENIMTPDILKKYIIVLEEFLKNGKLNAKSHNAILKIITFLSLPGWRNEHVELTAKCLLLFKNEVNKLDTPYLLLLYEVFFKIQEPGDLLNEIQRSAAKFWQQFEEDNTLNTNTALKLFSALIFFSSPLHRIQLRKEVEKMLNPNLDLRDLIVIRKIFSYVKVSDKKLCHKYWDIWNRILKKESDVFLIVKSCLNYMHFNIDIDNYRNFHFEKEVLELLKTTVNRKDNILPSDLGTFLTFVIYYSNDASLLQELLNKLKQNPIQLKSKEILMLSHTFNTRSNSCNAENFKEIKNILNQSTEYIFSMNDSNFENNSVLIKAAILRNDYDSYFMENLFNKFKDVEYMSSKLLENISFIFFISNTLIPEVFNKTTEYIIKNKNSIIGFNAEKILFLCFHLAYYPINADKFFQSVTDIIIRDQDRLSGLAFLQSALSLGFFNKLPSFLVKQVFNVEFMDRLDSELANCYSKETYPRRVRQTLMHLNRIVCLEYPEFNVPWFHEKYIKDVQKQYVTENYVPRSIKEYLEEIAGKDVLENVIAPYGYHIHFVINLNKENKVVSPNSKAIRKRVALLLIKHHAFTRFYSHLKGTYQMKIKHLEILGYSVSILKFDEWTNLLYTTERIDYLKKLIWPENYEIAYATKR